MMAPALELDRLVRDARTEQDSENRKEAARELVQSRARLALWSEIKAFVMGQAAKSWSLYAAGSELISDDELDPLFCAEMGAVARQRRNGR